MKTVIAILGIIIVGVAFYIYCARVDKDGAKIDRVDNKPQEIFSLESKSVSKDIFIKFKESLEISKEQFSTSNFETKQGVFGGYEVSYQAKGSDGKDYLYIEVNYSNGVIGYEIVQSR